MNALIIYDSEFGNTERVAREIRSALEDSSSVNVAPVAEAASLALDEGDLLLVGGPTQKHGISPDLRCFLDALPRRSLRGVRAAAFDTRYRMPRLLSGSAARQIAGRLRRAGCRLVAPPESFFVERAEPPRAEKPRHDTERLEPGEAERAREWARTLAVETRAQP